MSAAIQYKIGGDASELGKAFQHALRFTGDFTDSLKRAFSVRGLFDGLTNGLTRALGGNNLGEVFGNALKKAMGKEVLQQNFAGLLGGDEKQASAALDALKSFAEHAGIAGDELNDAARTLISGGGANAGRAVEDIKMLGEVARSTQRPIGELATVWAKMFADGAVSSRELLGLQGAGVNIEALANAAGMTGEEFKKLATDGELAFDTVANAMKVLTTTGLYAGQVERFKGTFAGLVEEIQNKLQKIPTAFFAGILGTGMKDSKEGLRDIARIVEGWVNGARQFGATLAAAVRVGKQLWDKGELFGTMKDGLIGAFGGAVDFLVKAFAGVASGFAAALLGVFDTIGDVIMSKLPSILGGDGRPMPDLASAIGAAGKNFVSGFKGGYDSTEGPGFGAEASRRFHSKVDPMMFEARGGAPAVMDAVMLAMSGIAGIMPGGDRLGAANAAKDISLGGGPKMVEPNAMSKIGLQIGRGGAQGEAHAKDTAKHTGTMTGQLDKMISKMDKWPITQRGVF